MTHPYDQSYLQEVVETQGAMFERLQDVAPTVDGLEFVRSYMKSDTRAFIDRGDVYLATIAYDMPVIARFYGIVVKMFFKPKEHYPAHIHAVYGETVGVFDIASMEMTEGDLPPNAQRLVRDWLPKHQSELAEMWRTQKIVELPPLD